jgi:hypothetical protein
MIYVQILKIQGGIGYENGKISMHPLWICLCLYRI